MNYHIKDIVIGQARVCWGYSWHFGELFEGWHLLGGGITNSRDIAETECSKMNEIMKGAA